MREQSHYPLEFSNESRLILWFPNLLPFHAIKAVDHQVKFGQRHFP